MKYQGFDYPVVKVNTCVVGTGAAGYNAACRLVLYGQEDIVLISEEKNAGTSRNTGSDKQTYYKLTLSGDTPDSVFEMAKTLFAGEAVDGDIALCEAALSPASFLRLVELGLPFPTNRYGEYVGYKTDHDPRNRATSIGPYTSKQMTEALEKDANNKNVRFINNLQVIKILVKDNKVYGLLCFNTKALNEEDRYTLIECENLIYATGGPAGMYINSVYPASQNGATGLAFEAGVKGKNLTEWQFGLASIKPRWNVSGTYMQVLPRFISTNKEGNDEREFLMDFFKNEGNMLSKVFLKGYQWPFDVRKVAEGSSIIDILVYIEQCKGRRVFLDFTKDPGGDVDFNSLDKEALDYLTKANALVKLPIERLKIMNQPAIDFYNDKGVNLENELLEISLCAQHNNGGLDINCWWQTNIDNFFAVGEVAASHGVYRPGGSALNAGQVGSTRAATYIANCLKENCHDSKVFEELALLALDEMSNIAKDTFADEENIFTKRKEMMKIMSECGGAIRDNKKIESCLKKVNELLDNFNSIIKYNKPAQLTWVYRLRDVLICQKCYLSAMLNYAKESGLSRGSALYTNLNGVKPHKELADTFTYLVDDGSRKDLIQEMTYKDNNCIFSWRKVRPIPENDDFFENTWRNYRKNKNIY